MRERLLSQMLGAVQDSIGGGWKVLVLDSTTTKLMSSALRMSDILDASESQAAACSPPGAWSVYPLGQQYTFMFMYCPKQQLQMLTCQHQLQQMQGACYAHAVWAQHQLPASKPTDAIPAPCPLHSSPTC